MKIGDKVKFISADEDQIKWGSNDDPRLLLNTSDIYEIENIEVHSWHTKIYLKGIKGKFNSVHFEIVKTSTIPKKGQKIYVPGAIYVYRGEDDFEGGLATISDVEIKGSPESCNYVFVRIKERPEASYNWRYLKKEQKRLKKIYKNQIAHPDPDYREEFNQPDADWHQ